MSLNMFNPGDALGRRVAATLYRCLEDLGSTKGAYYVADPREGTHYLASHYGWPRGTQPPEVLAADHPLLIWAHHERRSFAVSEPAKAQELADFCQGAKSPHLLVTPVFDKGERIGLLVQRDRLKGEPYDPAKDEARTASICEELVQAHRELHGLSRIQPSEPIPVQVPPSASMVPTTEANSAAPVELLEGIRATQGGSAGLTSIPCGHTTYSGLRMPEPESPAPVPVERAAEPGAPEQPRPRPGMFLPEQRTFFWEAAALLCQVLPLAAVSLWMDETSELRPVLTYSEYPLSSELKQQVLAHVTFHVPHVKQEELQILSRVENLENQALSGAFLSYLPVLLKEEGGGQDLLLLLRMDDSPFTATEQGFIQRVARMLGFHLQESRLHERYHRAFLSVSHRILASAEGRAPRLRNHSMNTAKLARGLALQMELPSSEVEAVSIAAILHDVGTLLLDPQLFNKPQLLPEEWARIRTHPVLASTFLKDFFFPFDVLNIIRHHHERWDGQGYPEGLRGEDIPVGSRIIALIEAYEVMSAGSPFKAPMGGQDVLEELRREAGAQFDPAIVPEFLRLLASRPVQ